jgi:hypothetical protein
MKTFTVIGGLFTPSGDVQRHAGMDRVFGAKHRSSSREQAFRPTLHLNGIQEADGPAASPSPGGRSSRHAVSMTWPKTGDVGL